MPAALAPKVTALTPWVQESERLSEEQRGGQSAQEHVIGLVLTRLNFRGALLEVGVPLWRYGFDGSQPLFVSTM